MQRPALLPLAAVAFGLLAVGAAQAAPDVATSAAEIQPLLIGAAVPDVTLHKVDGTAVPLQQAVAEKPTVLIFYRGGW